MKNCLLLITAFLLSIGANAQKITFFPNTPDVKVLNAKGDTLRNPFAGGMALPTFSNIDANFDGKQDLYIFEHFDSTIAIYINQGNGKYQYSPEYISQFPSMIWWSFLRDYNHDGLPDIFAYTHEQAGIEIYKNVSSGGRLKFKLVNPYLETSNILCNCIQAGQVYIDRVNMPSIADMDGDGDLDILALDPSGFVIEMYKNRSHEVYKNYDSLNYEQTDDYWGAIQTAGGVKSSADSFAHTPKIGLNFSTHCLKQKHAGGNMTALDADGDGDMDLLFTDVNGSIPMLLKNGKKEYSHLFDTITSVDSTSLKVMRYVPGAYFVDADDDGIRDLIVAPLQYGPDECINNVQYYHNDGKDNSPKFTLKQNNFLQDEEIDLGRQANPAFLDRDGDGIPEYLAVATEGDLNDASDRLVLYQNVGAKGAPVFKLINNDWLGLKSKNYHGLSPAFGDLDGDGLQDLLLGKNDGQLFYFHNKGTKSTDAFTLEANPLITDSIDVGNWSTPAIADLDKDGIADLVIGSESGKLAFYKGNGYIKMGLNQYLSYELKNSFFGNVITDDPTDTSTGRSANSAPVFADLDNNGVLDLVCGSATGTLYVYMDVQSNLNTTFYPEQNFLYNTVTSKYETRNFGNMVHPAVAILNKDSLPDLMIGNRKGGLYYYGSHSVISGVEETIHAASGFKVYPNPATQSFTITSENGIESYTLTNLLGQRVQSSSNTSVLRFMNVDVSMLPEGMYILNLRDSKGGISEQKIVVRR